MWACKGTEMPTYPWTFFHFVEGTFFKVLRDGTKYRYLFPFSLLNIRQEGFEAFHTVKKIGCLEQAFYWRPFTMEWAPTMGFR